MSSKKRIVGLAVLVVGCWQGACQPGPSGFEVTSYDEAGALSWTNRFVRGIYDVEFTESLENPVWEKVPAFTGVIATERDYSISLPLSSGKKFYRVVWNNVFVIHGTVVFHDEVVPNRVVELYGDGPVRTTVSDSKGRFFFADVSGNAEYTIVSPTSGDWVGIGKETPELGDTRNYYENIAVTRAVVLTSPSDDATVRSDTVAFEWEPLEEAASYTFTLTTESGVFVDQVNGISETRHSKSSGLTRGFTYRWWIRAIDGQGRYIGISARPNDFTFQ